MTWQETLLRSLARSERDAEIRAEIAEAARARRERRAKQKRETATVVRDTSVPDAAVRAARAELARQTGRPVATTQVVAETRRVAARLREPDLTAVGLRAEVEKRLGRRPGGFAELTADEGRRVLLLTRDEQAVFWRQAERAAVQRRDWLRRTGIALHYRGGKHIGTTRADGTWSATEHATAQERADLARRATEHRNARKGR
ncbi:MAG: hypothetical protein EPN43_11110 [Jatrophihabitans sp.]|nr:MAG: hypothetical protein EPN43_11110 [Jatrophihabitans sp.]